MRVPIDACCVGGPAKEMSAVSGGALLVIAAAYGVLGLIALAATLAFL